MFFNLVVFDRSCSKAFLLVINAMCIIMGVGTFTFSVVDVRIFRQHGEQLAIGNLVADIVIMCTSASLISVAILGCFGAVKESVTILYLYVGFLMILVIIELVVGIFMSVQRYDMELRVVDWIREDFFYKVSRDDLFEHRRLWDELQTSYECCGLSGPSDYTAIAQPISMACCPQAFHAESPSDQDLLYRVCLEFRSYYNEGCEDEILFALREVSQCLLGVAIVCVWFEAAGMVMGMWLANNLKYYA